MCGYFNDADGNIYRGFVAPSDALVAAARSIEREMNGDRVPESAWQAFFSPDCGAIEFPHFERMFRARTIAVAFMATQRSTRFKPPRVSSLRCYAD